VNGPGHGPGPGLGPGHGHGHGHSARASDDRLRLVVVLAITAAILVVEIIGATISGSLALLADAGHLLTDVAGLLVAVIAATLAARPATPARTWGFLRAEVLAATLQAAVLLAVGVGVLVEGVRRLLHPPGVAPGVMLVFGFVALAGNLVSVLVLSRGAGRSLNTRAARLEVINDALGALAVLLAAGVIVVTGWLRADAVVSVLIGLAILPRTARLLREAVDVLLEATPRGLDLDEVRRHLVGLDHVHAVHDLHASQIASGLPVLSAHVVVDDSCFSDGHAPQMLDLLQACVAGHFPVAVEHSTFQLEPVGHAQHEGETHH